MTLDNGLLGVIASEYVYMGVCFKLLSIAHYMKYRFAVDETSGDMEEVLGAQPRLCTDLIALLKKELLV